MGSRERVLSLLVCRGKEEEGEEEEEEEDVKGGGSGKKRDGAVGHRGGGEF